MSINCVLHGSLRKHYDSMKYVYELFCEAGINVLAPDLSAVVGETHGFVRLRNDKSNDPRLVELLYLQNILRLGTGFSYYVNPDGYIGKSSSLELGIDLVTNTRALFWKPPEDIPVYLPENSIWSPDKLAEYVYRTGKIPEPVIPQNERNIYALLQNLVLPGSVVAAGAVVESSRINPATGLPDILLVKSDNWGGCYTLIGETLRRNETLDDGLQRAMHEKVNIDCNAQIGRTIISFDEIPGSWYVGSIAGRRVFVDRIAVVPDSELKNVGGNVVRLQPRIALSGLPIEPNARRTLRAYTAMKEAA